MYEQISLVMFSYSVQQILKPWQCPTKPWVSSSAPGCLSFRVATFHSFICLTTDRPPPPCPNCSFLHSTCHWQKKCSIVYLIRLWPVSQKLSSTPNTKKRVENLTVLTLHYSFKWRKTKTRDQAQCAIPVTPTFKVEAEGSGSRSSQTVSQPGLQETLFKAAKRNKDRTNERACGVPAPYYLDVCLWIWNLLLSRCQSYSLYQLGFPTPTPVLFLFLEFFTS